MGIPKLFRWISERYPQLNRPASALPTPHCDNFYLDFNGVLHNSSRGGGGSSNDECALPTARPPFALASALFAAVERLVGLVSPTRLLYLAIDGVAPRAKLNQQRQRRFASARRLRRLLRLRLARRRLTALALFSSFVSRSLSLSLSFSLSFSLLSR
jgi:5'-3' exoribonuclease 1